MLSFSKKPDLFPTSNPSKKSVSYKKPVVMQFERRKPPIELTQNKHNFLHNKYTVGREIQEDLLTKRKMIEHPNRFSEQAFVGFEKVPRTIYVDSEKTPILQILRQIKEKALESGRRCFSTTISFALLLRL